MLPFHPLIVTHRHSLKVQIPDNISFEQATSVSLCFAIVVCGILGHHPEARSLDMPAPWEEGGTTKYAEKPALIVGGSSSVCQFGMAHVE